MALSKYWAPADQASLFGLISTPGIAERPTITSREQYHHVADALQSRVLARLRLAAACLKRTH